MSNDPAAKPDENEHLILVEDEEVQIEHHSEDWLAFACSGRSHRIVFLQFFTRYVLNDCLAWTEEIARYGLMWVTFIGAAIVVPPETQPHRRRGAAALPCRAVPARLLLAFIDIVKLFFMALLAVLLC